MESKESCSKKHLVDATPPTQESNFFSSKFPQDL